MTTTNTQTQHTPAPWEVFPLEKPESNLIATIRCEKQNLAIAKILWASTSDRTRQEAEANAQLIARAPELLQHNNELLKENEQLKEKLNGFKKVHYNMSVDLDNTKALNAELLEALKELLIIASDCDQVTENSNLSFVDEAIAKAEGKG